MAGAQAPSGASVGVFANVPELETERVLLRKMRLEEAGAMFAYDFDFEVARRVLWRTFCPCNTWRSRTLPPPTRRIASVSSGQ